VLLSLRSQILTAQTIIAQLQRCKIRRKYADGSADAPVQNQGESEIEGSTMFYMLISGTAKGRQSH